MSETKKRKIVVTVQTNRVGSADTSEFEVEPDATNDEIEAMAREAMFEMLDWWFTVDGEST